MLSFGTITCARNDSLSHTLPQNDNPGGRPGSVSNLPGSPLRRSVGGLPRLVGGLPRSPPVSPVSRHQPRTAFQKAEPMLRRNMGQYI